MVGEGIRSEGIVSALQRSLGGGGSGLRKWGWQSLPLHLEVKVLPSRLGYVEPDTNGGQSSDRWKGSREVPRGMAWLKKASWRKEY